MDAKDRLFEIIHQFNESEGGPERLTFRRGETLLSQGAAADEFFLIESGRFRVLRDGVDLAEIGSGAVAGEIAFFTGELRTATVMAARDSVVLRITRTVYDQLCRDHADLPHEIARILAKRLDKTSARVRPVARPPLVRTVALLPLGDGALPEGFAQRLADHASNYAQTRLATSQEAVEATGTDIRRSITHVLTTKYEKQSLVVLSTLGI